MDFTRVSWTASSPTPITGPPFPIQSVVLEIPCTYIIFAFSIHHSNFFFSSASNFFLLWFFLHFPSPHFSSPHDCNPHVWSFLLMILTLLSLLIDWKVLALRYTPLLWHPLPPVLAAPLVTGSLSSVFPAATAHVFLFFLNVGIFIHLATTIFLISLCWIPLSMWLATLTFSAPTSPDPWHILCVM